eukprot:CAMPEP_0115020222 /NCGR_PEP_ID=MMETSP0216-20121206/29958_1 /TAXON_ID=223996 /ORGANISM="Protocruzia adherens, Strain Boccale" /LENGTH=212 /DNA_ID=CAMNT_0002391937 /DNA_START=46 /DNA_END=684 /DNA_ORIENTATION=-
MTTEQSLILPEASKSFIDLSQKNTMEKSYNCRDRRKRIYPEILVMDRSPRLEKTSMDSAGGKTTCFRKPKSREMTKLQISHTTSYLAHDIPKQVNHLIPACSSRVNSPRASYAEGLKLPPVIVHKRTQSRDRRQPQRRLSRHSIHWDERSTFLISQSVKAEKYRQRRSLMRGNDTQTCRGISTSVFPKATYVTPEVALSLRRNSRHSEVLEI